MTVMTSDLNTSLSASKINLMLLASRIMLAMVFVVPGIRKLTDFSMFGSYMTGYGVPDILLGPATLLELGGGALLILGICSRTISVAFIVYLVVLSFIFHAFWSVDPKQLQAQLNLFLLHFGCVGGLLYVVAFGPGSLAVNVPFLRKIP